MRAAIFGDVGGHATQFFAALVQLGVDIETAVIPEDLMIIQLGDLIHKGPDSDLLVAFVDRCLTRDLLAERTRPVFERDERYQRQWLQLLGNHEMQHLNGYDFWRCDCSQDTVRLLRKWFRSGVATTVASIGHDPLPRRLASPTTVLSHGGVTRGFWKAVDPSFTPVVGVHAIRDMERRDFARLNRHGVMLGGQGVPSALVGPIWAAATEEVYPSWDEVGKDMNFNQAHGHTAPFTWDRQAWYPGTPLKYRKAMHAHLEDRAATYQPANAAGNFLALDPGFDIGTPRIDVQPHVLVENVRHLA